MRRNPRWRPDSTFEFFEECRKTRQQREREERERQKAQRERDMAWGVYGCVVAPTFHFPEESPTAPPGCCLFAPFAFRGPCVCIYDARTGGDLLRLHVFEDEGLDCDVGLASLRRASRPPSLCLHPHQWAARPGEQLAFPGPPPTLQGNP